MKYEKNEALFIVFEGIDGSGKDTHILILASRLEKLGFKTVITFEPWESEEAKRLKEIAAKGKRNLSPEEEAQLYLIDRCKHVKEIILPALEKGGIVLCNRYYYSTMAYQGALGADPEEIKKRNEAEVPVPDLVIMLKIDVEEAFKRIGSRGKALAAGYEKAGYLKKVAKILYNINAPYIKKIDSSRPQALVADDIFKAVNSMIQCIDI